MSSVNPSPADGLWRNNPVLVQLLGLSPLLAVTDKFVKALGLGCATLLVLTASSLVMSLARRVFAAALHLPVLVLVMATFTTCVDLLMQAFAYELHEVLGIFVPLIAVNCLILSRADQQPPLPATLNGLATGGGFLLVLLVMGSVREILGRGTWLADMHLVFGAGAAAWEVQILGTGFLFALLPPGAFIVAGLLLALKNIVDTRLQRRRPPSTPTLPGEGSEGKGTLVKGSRRVRTTGHIT